MNHRRENDAKSLLFPPRLQLRRNEPVWVAFSGSLAPWWASAEGSQRAVNPQALAARGGGAPEDWNYISWRGTLEGHLSGRVSVSLSVAIWISLLGLFS